MTLRTVVAFLVGSSAVAAQTSAKYPSCVSPERVQAEQKDANQKPQNNDGTVLVYVCPITGGGDIKPARMGLMTVIERDPAGQAYMDGVLNIHKIADDYRSKAPREEGDLISMEELRAIEKVSRVIRARDDVRLVELDEEGKARIVLHPGAYVVDVRGSGGVNEAFWLGTAAVESGKDTPLKMSRPLVAYAR